MLAMRMKRQRIKGTGVKLASDPSKEPNFYDMELPDLPDWKQSSLHSTPFEDTDEARSPRLTSADQKWFVGREVQEQGDDRKTSAHTFVSQGLLKKSELEGNIKLSSYPSNFQKSSQASMFRTSESSPDYVAKISPSDKKTKHRRESPLVFAQAIPQMPLLQNTEFSRGREIGGESITEKDEKLGITCFTSLKTSECPSNIDLSGGDRILQKELSDGKFVLQKQRQELELLTALTELKKQVRKIWSRHVPETHVP